MAYETVGGAGVLYALRDQAAAREEIHKILGICFFTYGGECTGEPV